MFLPSLHMLFGDDPKDCLGRVFGGIEVSPVHRLPSGGIPIRIIIYDLPAKFIPLCVSERVAADRQMHGDLQAAPNDEARLGALPDGDYGDRQQLVW